VLVQLRTPKKYFSHICKINSTGNSYQQAKMMQRAATSILPAAGNMLAQAQQQRGMATLKQISMRLKSVKNIQKITQSMKMVSAAKYTRAERELKQCRPIGAGSIQFYEKAEVAAPANESKKLYIAITSDRGENSIILKLKMRIKELNLNFRFVRCCAHWCRSSHSY
jgi:hypothetical protein